MSYSKNYNHKLNNQKLQINMLKKYRKMLVDKTKALQICIKNVKNDNKSVNLKVRT